MSSSVSPPGTLFESALVDDEPDRLRLGGMSLTSWQIVIWVLAGSVFVGVLITVFIAYVGYRNNVNKVLPPPAYSASKLLHQRDRLLKEIHNQEMKKMAEQSKSRQRELSLTQQEFLASKRAGRRPAVAGSSMVAEMGSKWWSQGSIRSGVSGISTPNELEYRNKRVEREEKEETGSMVVEMGDGGFTDRSQGSGVVNIQTPIGSLDDYTDEYNVTVV